VLWGAYAALVPDTKAMLGASDAQFGSLMLATPIAAVASMLLAPRIAPALGHHLLTLALAATGLAFMLPGWFPAPALFALSMVLVGATNGFLDVTMTARVSEIETGSGLHLMNLNHAAYSFGYAGAALATGAARTHGASPAMILSTAGLAVLFLVLATIERGEHVNGFRASRGLRHRLGLMPLWGGIIVLIAFLTENAAESWSALHIERTLGGSKAEGSFGPALLALTMGVGRIFGHALIARLSAEVLLARAALVAALGLSIAALAPSPAVAFAGLVVLGLGGAVLAPTAFSLIGHLAPDSSRTHALARATALGYMGYFFGPPALGLVSQLMGLRAAFLLVAGVVLVVILLVPLLLASRPQAAGPRPEPRP
jgi:predicted MFS family arabinose efflux permease